MSFRIRGFLIHLSASCLLAFIASCIVFLIWYPSPLGQAIGVTSIVLLLLGVDVIAGPLLTLAVCKAGKKSLKFDLLVIILLQLSAFMYGMYILAQGRPVWIVLHENEFHIVRAYAAKNDYQQKAKPEYQTVSLLGPKWVAIRTLANAEKEALFEGFNKGVIFQERADFYEPIENQAEVIRKAAQDITLLNQYNNPKDVSLTLSNWPMADAFLPLIIQETHMTVLIKRGTAKMIVIVDLHPFI